MSISFPSNPSVDDEYQGWVWDGQKWISKGGAGGGGLWEQNGDDIYYDKGDVGIGNETPRAALHVGVAGPGLRGGSYTKAAVVNQTATAINWFEIQSASDGRGGVIFSESAAGNYGLVDYDHTDDHMKFLTAGAERMRIDADGNVGIAAAPDTTGFGGTFKYLGVNGGSGYGVFNGQTTSTTVNKTAAQFMGTTTGTSGYQILGGMHVVNGASSAVNAEGALQFYTSTGGSIAQRMRIDANGRVDITGSLYVNGSEVGSGGGNFVPLSGNSTIAGTLTATDFVSTSDERLKDNITPMPIGLIDDIRPVSWEWKDGSGPSAGVVAQQLQSVGLGDYVHENEDGQLGVNYQALTAILLAEVIELKRSLK